MTMAMAMAAGGSTLTTPFSPATSVISKTSREFAPHSTRAVFPFCTRLKTPILKGVTPAKGFGRVAVRCESKNGCSTLGEPSESNSGCESSKRREFLLSGVSILALSNLAYPSFADTIPIDNSFDVLKDEINSYELRIPLYLPNENRKFSWIESRKPERYSSAAPLSPDARQRIVYERLDFSNNVVVSVSIGPPNKAYLGKADSDINSWEPINVARSVLADKSTARMSIEQRIKEIIIEDSSSKNIDGQPYWFYEHLAQKSPTIVDNSIDVYRHSLSVSAFRDGYIYSLNVSTLDSKWPQFEGLIRELIDSFRMVPTTQAYVPPWKDPWRFW